MIVAGTMPGEGAVLTRNREALDGVWRLDAGSGRWFVLQTNDGNASLFMWGSVHIPYVC